MSTRPKKTSRPSSKLLPIGESTEPTHNPLSRHSSTSKIGRTSRSASDSRDHEGMEDGDALVHFDGNEPKININPNAKSHSSIAMTNLSNPKEAIIANTPMLSTSNASKITLELEKTRHGHLQ